jgi:hypothetical protein
VRAGDGWEGIYTLAARWAGPHFLPGRGRACCWHRAGLVPARRASLRVQARHAGRVGPARAGRVVPGSYRAKTMPGLGPNGGPHCLDIYTSRSSWLAVAPLPKLNAVSVGSGCRNWNRSPRPHGADPAPYRVLRPPRAKRAPLFLTRTIGCCPVAEGRELATTVAHQETRM